MMELLGLLTQVKTFGPMVFLVLLAQQHLVHVGKLKKLCDDHDRLNKAFEATLTLKTRRRLENLKLI